MKIRKAFQGTIPENKILDTHSTSQTDTYSCNYVNGINSGLTTVNISTLGETKNTNEMTVGTYTIPSAGVYLILARYDTNYYGQSNRELATYIKKNGTALAYYNGTINVNAWLLSRTMVAMEQCNAGDTITFTIKSSTTASYSLNGGQVRILKLK